MSQDFVKQLQLAKQLEQKAKEAARGRETAEAKIQEATALLAKVKEMSGESAETEKMLTLASQSYSDKDYKEAMAYAMKSTDASGRARKQRLRDMLRDASSLLDKVSDLGKANPETAASLERAAKAVDNSDLDKAYEMTKETWDLAERNANRVLSDSFGQAQSSLLLAEKLGLKVDKQKSALSGCRSALETGNTVKSVEAIKSLLDVLRSLTLDRFVDRAAKVETLFLLQKRFPVDVAEAQSHLKEGREFINRSHVEKAFDSLDGSEEAFSRAFTRSSKAWVTDLEQQAEVLKSHHKKVEVEDLGARTLKLIQEEKYGQAIDLLDAVQEKVRADEREVLLEKLSEVQPRLRLAHVTQKDVSAALQKIESSRASLKADRFAEALRSVVEAQGIVEERLQGYDEVERELQSAQDLRSRCEDQQLTCPEGLKGMGAARRLTLKGEFGQAVDSLQQAQRAFRLTLENHFATGIMRLEMRLATAIRIGAEVSEENELLDGLTSQVRQGNFELVHGSLVTINSSVEEKVVAVVREDVRRAEEVLSHYAVSPEAEKALISLKEAKERLQRKEYQSAHDLVNSLLEDLHAERRKNLDLTLQDGRNLMEMAACLKAESVTLKDKMQRAEELRTLGRLDDSSALAEEVVSYGRNIVSAELDNQLTELVRQISVTRKEGVEVGQPEHLTEQAGSALRKEELASAFELTTNARHILNEIVAQHQALKDGLQEKETLIEETKRSGIDVGGATEAVARAGMHIRSGNYAEGQKELDKAGAELRQFASPLILDLKLRKMADLAKLRDRVGYEGSEKRLKSLGPMDAGKLDDSLNALSVLKEEWERDALSGLEKEMASCQKDLDKATAAGSFVGQVQELMVSGRNALNERKLADCMRAIELVRTELGQTAQADRDLNDLLAAVDDAVEQLREMKTAVKDVTVLLEQARALKRTGNAAAAAEQGRKASERAVAMATEKVTALTSFAGGMTAERASWEDLRPARKLHEDIQDALKNRRYRHAFLLARSFHEELERVLQDKAQAEDELRKFEGRLREEAKAGLRPESLKNGLEKIKALMAQGCFVQALSAVNASQAELKALAEMYEVRLAEYNSLRESLNSLEVLDPRKDNIEELLDQTWSSLKELKFESSYLYLRRARNALSEFLTMRTNELVWEFNPLHDLIKRLKLQKKFATEIAEIEKTSTDTVTPRDLNRLSRNLELVKAGMKDIYQEQRETVRKNIEKASRSGKQTGRSWELWSDSASQAQKGDLWEAFNSLEAAVNAVGRKPGESSEQLSKQLFDVLERANRNRIQLQGTEKAYADALSLMKEGKNAVEQLKKACEISRKEIRATYPDITAELQFVGAAVDGRPMDIVVHLRNDGQHEARKVKAFIFGDVDVKGMVEIETLKAGEATSGRITVTPMKPGLLTLGISVKCKPLLTDEDVLYDSKFDLDVK
ncbi:MAG: hypothetical protein NT131_07200 [Methanomassiliicoccales archaeon]|nr:hypothetical protein [Methanomassiliicoccales archaeon]